MPTSWHFSQEPARYKPIACKVCKTCWFDLRAGRCVYGGPFAGFKTVNGRPLTEAAVLDSKGDQ
jgi:hypothetical protein